MGTTILTVLIADDNPRLRALIRRILAQEPNIRVVGEAGDGMQAIQFSHERRPDIVLLDLVMPQVSGLEATQQIKADRSETKIIIMTVHTEAAYRQAAEASGADAFLLKKTLMTALLPTIQGIRCSMPPLNTP
jgi:DNA-binding NarL/FixJ family response regulator